MNLERLWHWAGGGLPLGPGVALALALIWLLVAFLVVRPTGALRGRSPWRWVLPGWLLLAALHTGLRARLTPSQPEGLLFWPPEAPLAPAGEAVFARVERRLRPWREVASRWQEGPARLLITSRLLESGRAQPATPASADSLMRLLELAWLVNLAAEPDGSTLCLWRRAWEVTTLEDREPCPQPGNADSLGAALDRLLARHVAVWARVDSPAADSAGPGAEPWLAAGLRLAAAGQWDSLQVALANALAREPEHPLVYWQLAHLARPRLRQFGLADAAAARTRCLELQPLCLPALLDQAPDWVRHRHGGRAARAVDAALAAYPRHAELLLLRGNLAYQLVEHDRAVACYEACSRAAPGDWRPLLNLGQLWVVLRQWERALPVLERAVTLGAPTTAQELVAHCREKLARKVADSSRTGR